MARGRTADVYAWEEGYVLKLFHDWFAREDIEFEARLARAVHASGLPVPAVGNVIEVEGRYGLVYEWVDGPPMLDLMSRRPWRVFDFARRLAELQFGIHTTDLSAELPSQRRRLERKIRAAAALPADTRAGALAALETMPDGDRVCHGDFHPANVLMTTKGDVVIDWIDATRGNPIADVARTTIIAIGAVESGQLRSPLLKAYVRLLHRAYLRHYFGLRPEGRDEYRYWLPIVAAARLSESIPEVEQWLLAQALTCRPMPRSKCPRNQ